MKKKVIALALSGLPIDPLRNKGITVEPFIVELNENDTITKVKCSATTLPTGFNIKIYGVRA